MHDSVMTFGRSALGAADIRRKRVVEVGSMNVNGSLRAYVEALGPSKYIGVDFIAGNGVDVVCDASRLAKRFGKESFDVVISTEMLEHAENWRRAIAAMKRVLVPGGLIVLTARGPGFPLHSFPHDWHRFTLDDVRRIFADFQIDRLEEDPQFAGFMLRARKPLTWRRKKAVDLADITVAPADEVNAPRGALSGRLEEQIVEVDADILVGVPCYKDGPMVDRCLSSLREPKVQLLIVDNGSGADVKQVIEGKGVVIRNDVNCYVNPAWNQMMRFFLERVNRYDLLVIANSDLVLDAGWAVKLRAHREKNRQEQIIFGKIKSEYSMGAFFAMTSRSAQACYPIPDDLLIYGGDDFIFEVNRRVGLSESVVEALSMFHAVSGTISKSPELWEIGKRDNKRWHQHVLPKIVPQRVQDFLARDSAHAGNG